MEAQGKVGEWSLVEAQGNVGEWSLVEAQGKVGEWSLVEAQGNVGEWSLVEAQGNVGEWSLVEAQGTPHNVQLVYICTICYIHNVLFTILLNCLDYLYILFCGKNKSCLNLEPVKSISFNLF